MTSAYRGGMQGLAAPISRDADVLHAPSASCWVSGERCQRATMEAGPPLSTNYPCEAHYTCCKVPQIW